MKRTLLIFSIFILCFSMAMQAYAEPTGTLRVALSTMPNALDLPNAAEKNATIVCYQLYDSLVWMDATGVLHPALATSWTLSEDQKSFTFKLRKGVKFHNGEDFTAESVLFSWQYGSREKMKYRDRWTMAKSVEIIDDYTVKISTEKPNPLLLRTIYADWGMMPKKYFEKVGEKGFAKHPVGTGAFKFKRWAKGDRIEFEANPDYWEKGLPKVKNLVFRPIPESATRSAAIQAGEIDIVTRLSSEEAQQLESAKDVRIIDYPLDRVFYIAFNNLTTGKGKPTEDPKVRQAINYAIDVDVIIDALFSGKGRPATGLMTSENLGFDKSVTPFGYDPEKAKDLLKEAGYGDGFKMDFACPSGAYSNFEQVCEAVQGFLEDVGIIVDLELMESGKYWELESKKQLPPLFGDSWSENTGESYPRLTGALGGMNASYSAWSDPKIDQLLDSISFTVDDTKRSALYSELQRYMKQNPPFAYLYEPVTFEAVRSRVQNHKPRSSEVYFLKTVSVKD